MGMSTMKPILVTAAVLVLAGGCAAVGVNERQMTLDEIVSMSRAGAGDSVIGRQIEATRSEFSLTSDEISRLKTAGVSDGVIETMIESGRVPRYFDYEYPYPYRSGYYGYPPYTAYRRSGLLGRFYFYGPPYPYGIPDTGRYDRWRDYLENEYDSRRRGDSGNRDMERRNRSGEDDE